MCVYMYLCLYLNQSFAESLKHLYRDAWVGHGLKIIGREQVTFNIHFTSVCLPLCMLAH